MTKWWHFISKVPNVKSGTAINDNLTGRCVKLDLTWGINTGLIILCFQHTQGLVSIWASPEPKAYSPPGEGDCYYTAAVCAVCDTWRLHTSWSSNQNTFFFIWIRSFKDKKKLCLQNTVCFWKPQSRFYIGISNYLFNISITCHFSVLWAAGRGQNEQHRGRKRVAFTSTC